MKKRVVVIGGGISGLAAAHRLVELQPDMDLTLLEASDRLGGVLRTERRDGFLIECGADSFITNVPYAVDLARRIGLEDDLLPTTETHRRALVVSRGRLRPLPDDFVLMTPRRIAPLLTTPVLSLPGKLRAAWEFFVPRRTTDGDESLASFARRRLGREAYQRLVQPLVGGIYTADPEKLSMQATFPKLLADEREHGGLIRAARAVGRASRLPDKSTDSGARYSLFVTPRDGLESFAAAIAEKLPPDSVRLNARATDIRAARDGWNISVHNGESLHADALIVAVPAPIAAKLIRNVDTALATELAGIEYAGASVVSLGYARNQISHPLDAFGFVAPIVERRRIVAGSFSSVKFPGRAPAGQVLIRTFVGGALQPELNDLGDVELTSLAHVELSQLLGITGTPTLTHVYRWTQSMPQYHLGHVERMDRIEALAAAHPHLALAGNAYHGVGIPHAIHSGEQAAERITGNDASNDPPVPARGD